jgi:EAL domain-containing protein (putative c-di-GMP-specific phosphodiesterase class I)
MGCDEMQGYHFSRPLPVDQLENFLAAGFKR